VVRRQRVGLRATFLLSAALGACSSTPPQQILPESINGGWTRTEVVERTPERPTEPISTGSIKRIVECVYDGPGKISARVYEVTAPAVGLDFVQRWQAPPNVDYFYEGSFVVVITSLGARPPGLNEFNAALRVHLRSLK
jgi:hypothetical protein